MLIANFYRRSPEGCSLAIIKPRTTFRGRTIFISIFQDISEAEARSIAAQYQARFVDVYL